MNQINGKRIIISGLISAKLDVTEELSPVRNEIKKSGGEIVAELIQRRGASRSKKPGGALKMDLPLNAQTYISSGKVEELRALSEAVKAQLIVFINPLTQKQLLNIKTISATETIIIPLSSLKA